MDTPVEVGKYEIGEYQVCEKWLKDRQGKELSRAELQQDHAILVDIAETLRIMKVIDRVLIFNSLNVLLLYSSKVEYYVLCYLTYSIFLFHISI